MHPVFSRFGLWWEALIRYSPAVQRWLLERWFVARRANLRNGSDFLALALTNSVDETIPSNELRTRLGPKKRV